MPDARVHIEEGIRCHKVGMLERAIHHFDRSLDETGDPAVRGEVLCRQSHVYRSWCRWDDAVRLARRAAELARGAGLQQLLAESLNAEAIVHLELSRFDEAVLLFERILALPIDDRMRGIAFQNLGSIAAQRADLERAETYYRESYKYFALAGYQWGEAFALTNFAAVSLDLGRVKVAEVLGSQALRAAKKVGDLELVGISSLNLAEALAAQGILERASALASEALGYFEIEESQLRRAQCFRVLADIQVMAGERGEAQLLYAEALKLAEMVGAERETSRIRDCMQLAEATA